MTPAEAALEAEAFNRRFPVGAAVRYDGALTPVSTVTTSRAFVSGDEVFVHIREGHLLGAVSIWHISQERVSRR